MGLVPGLIPPPPAPGRLGRVGLVPGRVGRVPGLVAGGGGVGRVGLVPGRVPGLVAGGGVGRVLPPPPGRDGLVPGLVLGLAGGITAGRVPGRVGLPIVPGCCGRGRVLLGRVAGRVLLGRIAGRVLLGRVAGRVLLGRVAGRMLLGRVAGRVLLGRFGGRILAGRCGRLGARPILAEAPGLRVLVGGRFIDRPALLCPPARPRCGVLARAALKFLRDGAVRCWALKGSIFHNSKQTETTNKRNNIKHLAKHEWIRDCEKKRR